MQSALCHVMGASALRGPSTQTRNSLHTHVVQSHVRNIPVPSTGYCNVKIGFLTVWNLFHWAHRDLWKRGGDRNDRLIICPCNKLYVLASKDLLMDADACLDNTANYSSYSNGTKALLFCNAVICLNEHYICPNNDDGSSLHLDSWFWLRLRFVGHHYLWKNWQFCCWTAQHGSTVCVLFPQ